MFPPTPLLIPPLARQGGLQEQGSHGFAIGMKTTQCKVGVKYQGLTGIGGFYKSISQYMYCLLIPIQAILDADCKVGSVHAFLNSAKGKICIKKSKRIALDQEAWSFVPYGFYVVATTIDLWEDMLKISGKGGD